MTVLNASLAAWNTKDFIAVLKTELEQLRSDVLPIVHVVGEGNRLDESDIGVIVNEVKDDERHIYTTVGVFFGEVVNCLTCSDGDGMCDEAYYEIKVTIDKTSGEAQFEPL